MDWREVDLRMGSCKKKWRNHIEHRGELDSSMDKLDVPESLATDQVQVLLEKFRISYGYKLSPRQVCSNSLLGQLQKEVQRKSFRATPLSEVLPQSKKD